MKTSLLKNKINKNDSKDDLKLYNPKKSKLKT